MSTGENNDEPKSLHTQMKNLPIGLFIVIQIYLLGSDLNV